MRRAVVEETHLCLPGEIRLYAEQRKTQTDSLKEVGKCKEAAVCRHVSFSPFDVRHQDNEIEAGLTGMVSSGPQVILLDALTGMKETSIRKFGDAVTSCHARQDGKLYIAGSGDGSLRIFGAAKRKPLRCYKEHEKGVVGCGFLGTKIYALSVGDDLKAKVYNIQNESSVMTGDNIHEDRILSVDTITRKDHPVGPTMFMTSSLDSTVKIWDYRKSVSQPAMLIDLAAREEGAVQMSELSIASARSAANIVPNVVKFFENDQKFAAAAGSALQLWDLRKLAPYLEIRNHLNTITGLDVSQNDRYILTSSLDHTVKLTAVHASSEEVSPSGLLSSNYRILTSLRYENERGLSCAMAPDMSRILVGTDKGYHLYQWTGSLEEDERQRTGQTSGSRLYTFDPPPPLAEIVKRRSAEEGPVTLDADSRVSVPFHPMFQRQIKAFEYQRAVLAAVKTGSSELFVGLCEELISRGSLGRALHGMDEEMAIEFMQFMVDSMRLPVSSLNNVLLIALDSFLHENQWVRESRDEAILEAMYAVEKTLGEDNDRLVAMQSLKRKTENML